MEAFLKIKIDQFEGPLNLLLGLIEERQLDISQVSLADVTDQYLEAINSQGQMRPEILADFLVIAAKLLYIKSKILLPNLEIEEEEDEIDLEKQLRMYKEFVEASKQIEAMINQKRFAFYREKPLNIEEAGFNPPKNATPEKMMSAFKMVVERLKPLIKLPQEMIKKTISIRERIEHIRNEILVTSRSTFSRLLKGSSSKVDVIVTFLALLELVKQRTVSVNQCSMFDTIEIELKKQEEQII